MPVRREVVILLLLMSGFCAGFVDLLKVVGQAYGGGTNLDQINPYGDILGPVNTNALAAHQLRQLHHPGNHGGNQLGAANARALNAHQLQQHLLAAQLAQSGAYMQGQPQGQLQGQGQQGHTQGHNLLTPAQANQMANHAVRQALLRQQQLLRRAGRQGQGRFQGQGHGQFQGQGQGHGGHGRRLLKGQIRSQLELTPQQLQYLGLLAQGQYQHLGQGHGHFSLLQSLKQGRAGPSPPQNYLDILMAGQDPSQDLEKILANAEYDPSDDDEDNSSHDHIEEVGYEEHHDDEDYDGEEPVYSTNAQGELVTVQEGAKRSSPEDGGAKIGDLTGLIGGLGDHFDHDFQLHEVGGHSSGGYGGDHGHSVKLVIEKSKEKKKKIISTFHGFYIPGGTAMFGKFKDAKSCQKACAITATCFAGDYDPWLQKCFLHSNITACMALKAHPSVMHFSKVPCDLVDTTRGLITLGTQIFSGLEQLGVKDLKTCLKRCATAGGGIAPTTAEISTTPQLCFGIDYDFATHKCFFHVNADLCPAVDPIPTPVTLSPMMSSVNILLCPLVA